jgi:histidine ammonia-lyase
MTGILNDKILDDQILLEPQTFISLKDYENVVFNNKKITVGNLTNQKLNRVRGFIDHLLKHNITAYGITTGFADLRCCAVNPKDAALLSENIILSHDAATGPLFEDSVVLGAMFFRAQSLAKGYSGFQADSLKTLVDMINHKIIPKIPTTGSLGASGDLAFLARLGRAMQGHAVEVSYLNQITTADKALSHAKIKPFQPLAKEGLALTNGTSFMISMLALAWKKQWDELNNMLALIGLFLNATCAIDAAFSECVQHVRGQKGQSFIAKHLSNFFKNSPFVDRSGVQQDYCIRCIPQILGPKFEIILEQETKILQEMNAVTDNPLIFEGDAISADVSKDRLIPYLGSQWATLSGGNFHGELLTTIADAMTAANAKIALMLERQITYLLNPNRNGNLLPTYLIFDKNQAGLHSGYMITQYTANALAQKIAALALPSQMFNLTSANESEDVVSYGATACQRLLEQLELFHQLNSIYLTVVAQSYGITRLKYQSKLDKNLLCEKLFSQIINESQIEFPTRNEESFNHRFKMASKILKNGSLIKLYQQE